jgi:hypothetical protein
MTRSEWLLAGLMVAMVVLACFVAVQVSSLRRDLKHAEKSPVPDMFSYTTPDGKLYACTLPSPRVETETKCYEIRLQIRTSDGSGSGWYMTPRTIK